MGLQTGLSSKVRHRVPVLMKLEEVLLRRRFVSVFGFIIFK